jgi:hypothetical protein
VRVTALKQSLSDNFRSYLTLRALALKQVGLPWVLAPSVALSYPTQLFRLRRTIYLDVASAWQTTGTRPDRSYRPASKRSTNRFCTCAI